MTEELKSKEKGMEGKLAKYQQHIRSYLNIPSIRREVIYQTNRIKEALPKLFSEILQGTACREGEWA